MRYPLPARIRALPLLALACAALTACASGDPPPRELDANGLPVRRRAQLTFYRPDYQPEVARIETPPPKPVKEAKAKPAKTPASKPAVVAAASPSKPAVSPPPEPAVPIPTAPARKAAAPEPDKTGPAKTEPSKPAPSPPPPPAKPAPPPAPDTNRARVDPNIVKPKVIYAGTTWPA